MQDFIKNIPKAELHLHIEGTLEPEMMLQLAERNKVKLPYDSIEAIQAAYNFEDLQSFLDLYYAGMQVLQTEQDFYDLTWAYLKKAHQDRVCHTEIFFDPQAHLQRGISIETVITGIRKALQEGEKQLHITSHLILCFLRDLPVEDAMKTLQLALPYKEHFIGVGLDSAEANFPPNLFAQVFVFAREQGLYTVAHAGEEGPADYIWQALNDCQVKRIDHGVRCIEDPKLMDYLVQYQVPLTLCPLSNIKLCVYDNLSQHPLKQLLDKGLCVTVNSDDPAYFAGYVVDNYSAVQEAFDLTREEIKVLAINSINASFISATQKQTVIQEINDYRG